MLHQDVKSPEHLGRKNQAKLHLCRKQSIKRVFKKGVVFKYPKTFQRDNGPEFKN